MSPEAALRAFVEHMLADLPDRPVVLGLCGAQGSGKSTLAAAIARRVPGTVVLSLDDLYLSRDRRRELADRVHPLFATRGVPGTHDVALGIATLDALRAGKSVALPQFDKASDDPLPVTHWPCVQASRLIVFEGWCVGARPLDPGAIDPPINDLERGHDPDGIWRHAWANALAGAYQDLFARIDRLVLLGAPGWSTVLDWRLQQEHALRATGAHGAGVMDDTAVARFVSHYERLTRHIFATMPSHADLVLSLAADRNLIR